MKTFIIITLSSVILFLSLVCLACNLVWPFVGGTMLSVGIAAALIKKSYEAK